MAALRSEVKVFIVQALACFDTPSQVVESVKKEFKVEIRRQQCESHDPTKFAGRGLGAKWVELFYATRKRFREETEDIPIANRAYRLRALNRMAGKAEDMRNLPLAVAIIEQAAKEVGDMHVNRRLDADKPPVGSDQGGISTAPEYKLSPDEDVPDQPVL